MTSQKGQEMTLTENTKGQRRIIFGALKFHSRHLAFRRKNATPSPLKVFGSPRSLEYPLRARLEGLGGAAAHEPNVAASIERKPSYD